MDVIKIDNNKTGFGDWLKENKEKIYNVVLVIITIILGLHIISIDASAAGEINITNPTNYADPITTSLIKVDVNVNGSTYNDVVKVKIIESVIIKSLSPIYPGLWTTNFFDFSTLPNGNYMLQAIYIKDGTATPVLSLPINIILNRPIQYGSVSITVKDSNNNPLNDVLVIPSNNRTNSDGVVNIGRIMLPSVTNFTLTKYGYNTTYSGGISFTDNVVISKSIIMSKLGGDLRDLNVIGYKNMIAERGAFILVTDKISGEKINGARVAIYNGASVESLPGETVNGRIFMSIIDAKSGSKMIDVSKSGYNDFTDTFDVWAAPVTPTPIPTTPVPTPVPTIDKKWRAEVGDGVFLTNDEYLQWIEVQESRKRNETLSQQNLTAIPSSKESTFPWVFLLMSLMFVGVVIYRFKDKISPIKSIKSVHSRLIKNREDSFRLMDDDVITDFSSITPTNTIECDLCDWGMKVSSDVEQTIINTILDTHKKEKHPSESKG